MKERHRCPECGGMRLSWTRAELVAACKKFAAKNGRAPKTSDWFYSTPDHPTFRTVIRTFGSWNGMVEAAGFRARPNGGGHFRFTRDEMIEALFQWTFANGRLPKMRDWQSPAEGRPTRQQVQKQFGGWNAFLVVAGYEPGKPYRSRQGYSAQAGAATQRIARETALREAA